MNIRNDVFNLKVIVICNDGRNDTLVKLLQHQVTELYMLKAGRCKKFTPDDPDGLSMPRNQLPITVNALLFHSTDLKLWKDVQIKAEYTFEFNTPGSPLPKENVLPIYRQTFPYFAITPNDVDELLSYISGRHTFPSMCQPPFTLDILPAMLTLCQFYLDRVTKEAIIDEKVTQPEWWLSSLGLLQQDEKQLNPLTYHSALKKLKAEWENLNAAPVTHNCSGRFVKSLVIEQSEYCEVVTQPVQYQTVVDVYNELTIALSPQVSSRAVAASVDSDEIPSINIIVAIKGSFAAIAAATVITETLRAKASDVRLKMLEPEDPKVEDTFPKNSILILADFQVASLPALRLQGFAGAVLVLSRDSFSNLKRKYRVLRFGQGSHDALTILFTLPDLLVKAQNLVPMELENLRFFQNELKAIDKIYQKRILPILTQLEQPALNLEVTTQEISTLIEQMRTETPVACHTVVTINHQPLQIQQHLRQALDTLQKQGEVNSKISYWKAIFEQWYKLVQSAAGESLKLAS